MVKEKPTDKQTSQWPITIKVYCSLTFHAYAQVRGIVSMEGIHILKLSSHRPQLSLWSTSLSRAWRKRNCALQTTDVKTSSWI